MSNQKKSFHILVQLWIMPALLLIISGCSSSTSIEIITTFPQVLSQPKPISAVIVFQDSFSTYQAQPMQNTNLSIGTAQVQLFKNVYKGLFKRTAFVTADDNIDKPFSLVITPSVREVQISMSSDNYMNFFEVWIKYNFEIKTENGETLTNWFVPAYGKTPNSFMTSKSAAIEQATTTAIRDAGAKLILDFYQIPAVYDWLSKQHIEEDSE